MKQLSPVTAQRVHVDRSVIDSTVLMARIDEVLGQVDTSVVDLHVPPRRLRPSPFLDASRGAERLHQLCGRVVPPGIVQAPGLKGRVAATIKRSVRRVTHWYVEPRFNGQQEIDAEIARFATDTVLALRRTHLELIELTGEVDVLRGELTAAQRTISRQSTSLLQTESQLHELRKDLDHVGDVAQKLRDQEAQTRRIIQVGSPDVEMLREQLATVMTRLGISAARGAHFDYAAFEDRFRGDSDVLAAVQADYVSKFAHPALGGPVVDIGCGRGEMMEALTRAGHQAIGVELDANMLAACRAKGLDVVDTDGVMWLETAAPRSLLGVFSAQVVEHLLTPELERFVAATYAALKQEGVLVVETINPRSLHALANHFFADLSHVRPIHPETLRFMCEQAGFAEVALVEQSPHPALAQLVGLDDGEATTSLIRDLANSVFGYQDYAIVATKR